MRKFRHYFLPYIVPTKTEKAERVARICGNKKLEIKRPWLSCWYQENSILFIVCIQRHLLSNYRFVIG